MHRHPPSVDPTTRAWPRTLQVLEEGRAAGWHTGAQIALSTPRGSVDLTHGEAQPGHPMRPDSVPPWLSAGKPITAVALARLVDAGRLHWDDPVTTWIPEFGIEGKESITLRHLLTHTGGFRGADPGAIGRTWDESVAQACAAPLESGWVVGETAGYHANGSWFVLGEILQRVTGQPFADVIRSEVFDPLGLDEGWFGIDAATQVALANRWVQVDRTGRDACGPDPVLNDREEITRCRPGSGLRAPAWLLAGFYRRLLDPPRGWLSPGVLAELTSPQRTGRFDQTFLAVIDFGLGFILNSDRPGTRPVPYGYGPHAGPRTFGHSGNQSACAFADPDHDLTVAWVCNGLPGELFHQRRQRALNAAIYEDLGLAG